MHEDVLPLKFASLGLWQGNRLSYKVLRMRSYNVALTWYVEEVVGKLSLHVPRSFRFTVMDSKFQEHYNLRMNMRIPNLLLATMKIVHASWALITKSHTISPNYHHPGRRCTEQLNRDGVVTWSLKSLLKYLTVSAWSWYVGQWI